MAGNSIPWKYLIWRSYVLKYLIMYFRTGDWLAKIRFYPNDPDNEVEGILLWILAFFVWTRWRGSNVMSEVRYLLRGKTTNPPTRVGGLVVLPLIKAKQSLGSNPPKRVLFESHDETSLRSVGNHRAPTWANPRFSWLASHRHKSGLPITVQKKGGAHNALCNWAIIMFLREIG